MLRDGSVQLGISSVRGNSGNTFILCRRHQGHGSTHGKPHDPRRQAGHLRAGQQVVYGPLQVLHLIITNGAALAFAPPARSEVKKEHMITSPMEYPCPEEHLTAMAKGTMAEHNAPMRIVSRQKPTGKAQTITRGEFHILQNVFQITGSEYR